MTSLQRVCGVIDIATIATGWCHRYRHHLLLVHIVDVDGVDDDVGELCRVLMSYIDDMMTLVQPLAMLKNYVYTYMSRNRTTRK